MSNVLLATDLNYSPSFKTVQKYLNTPIVQTSYFDTVLCQPISVGLHFLQQIQCCVNGYYFSFKQPIVLWLNTYFYLIQFISFAFNCDQSVFMNDEVLNNLSGLPIDHMAQQRLTDYLQLSFFIEIIGNDDLHRQGCIPFNHHEQRIIQPLPAQLQLCIQFRRIYCFFEILYVLLMFFFS